MTKQIILNKDYLNEIVETLKTLIYYTDDGMCVGEEYSEFNNKVKKARSLINDLEKRIDNE